MPPVRVYLSPRVGQPWVTSVRWNPEPQPRCKAKSRVSTRPQRSGEWRQHCSKQLHGAVSSYDEPANHYAPRWQKIKRPLPPTLKPNSSKELCFRTATVDNRTALSHLNTPELPISQPEPYLNDAAL